MAKRPVICLMGPTAVGKTDLAIELYLKLQNSLPLEIISVDSAMVYRGLDIGTGKPSEEVLAAVPHQLVNIREPFEIYSVADFCQDALECIRQAHSNNRVPLLVGGTMMYFRSLQAGLTLLPASNAAIREELLHKLNTAGLVSLYQELINIDPTAANRINPNDTQRIIRALEVYLIAGKNITELLASNTHLDSVHLFAEFNNINLILAPGSRSFLHEIIAKRFYNMLDSGFVSEVEQLMLHLQITSDLPALRSCGYKQIGQYLLGNFTEKEMIEKSISATRQLAKRQIDVAAILARSYLVRYDECELQASGTG